MQLKVSSIAIFIGLKFSCIVSAAPNDSDFEPLAIVNIKCAAFYGAAQLLIKPDAKKEYESKSSAHYVLASRFSSSYETVPKRIGEEVQLQAIEALSLKDHTKVANFLSANSIRCSSIELHSIAVINNATN